MERACPSEIDLDRAFGTEDPAIAAHVAGCEQCSAQWEATTAAITLARDLPADIPPSAHREDLRTVVLATSDPRPARARSRGWVIPVLAIGAAAAVLIAIRGRAPTSARPTPVASAPSNHGSVHAHAAAAYTLASSTPDEIVRLRDGTIDVDVRPLGQGDRFRVLVGADEIEVRGTSFEVVAAADHLVAVHVVHGRVEVRHLGAAAVLLTPGQSWHATETAVAPPLTPAPAPVPPAPAPVRSMRRPPPVLPVPEVTPRRAPDPQEASFVAGWDAMRRDDFGAAASAFARVVALDPKASVAEDAAFWHGVTLARLGRSAEAIAALREFIEGYPSSPRTGEASAMLGWLLVDAKELDEARRRFDAAVTDQSPAVAKSARDGLDAMSRGRR